MVLAGGRSRRFGADKLEVALGGSTLLAGVVDAASAVAGHVVVVGPHRAALGPHVVVVREDPPWSGPLAAVAAALPHVTTGVVLVLAGDLLGPGPLLPRLLAELEARPEAGAAVARDAGGRRQPLLAAYRAGALRRSLEGTDPRDRPARALLEGLEVVDVDDPDGWSRDVDRPEDLPAPD
ncbi:MAG: NTP transferase domain-containing protein [Frankiales bacterium]|nr:NTP transferase domain-containing protein [Frankiales bacterium]